MNFSEFNLDARLMHAITKAGYDEPTPVQAAAIPIALSGSDLVGTAQTGTGKTAAFVLPILNRLINTPPTQHADRKLARALIITPTRELAEQILDTIKDFAKGTGIRAATIYGGVGMGEQEKALRNGVEILVCCPGRMLDHMQQGSAKLEGIEVLVIDEADRMFDMGFLPGVRRIIERTPNGRQTMMFSATFPPDVEKLAAFALRTPKRVAIGMSAPAVTVTHAFYPVPSHLKTKLLLALLKKTDAFSMLVFTRTKHKASRLAKTIQHEGLETAALHGDKSQNQRQQALDMFKSGKVQVLVATDIAARGIDVETVTHVINYDVPDTADTYIHRIGRTGRAEREGDAFTLITPEDFEEVRMIERALKTPVERRQLDGFDYSEKMPDRPVVVGSPDRTTPESVPNRYIQRPSFGPGGFKGGFNQRRPVDARPQGRSSQKGR